MTIFMDKKENQPCIPYNDLITPDFFTVYPGIKKSPENSAFSRDSWRKRWDSNPRDVAVYLISRGVI